jgi:hypothetical protein
MADKAPSSHEVSPDLIMAITQNDVLMGRGSGPNEFMGNQLFRSKVEGRKEEYKSAPQNELKKKIAEAVIDEVHAQGGRFLKQFETEISLENALVEEATWCEVEEKVALEKCKQALRQKKKPVGKNESRKASSSSSDVGVDIPLNSKSFGEGFKFKQPTSFCPNLALVSLSKLAGPPFGAARPMFFLQQQSTSPQPMAVNPVLSPHFKFCVQNPPTASKSQGQDQCGSVNSSSWIQTAWTQTDPGSCDLAQSLRSLSTEKKVVASACAVPTTTSPFTSEKGASAAAALQEDIYGGDAVLDDMLDQMDRSSTATTSGLSTSEVSVSGEVPQDDMLEFFLEEGSDSPPFTGSKRRWNEVE